MRRYLAVVLAASVVLVSGCDTGEEGSLNPRGPDLANNAHDASSAPANPALASGDSEGTPIAAVASTAGGESAAAFPISTPPSDRPSVTPPKYWTPKRVNTQAPFTEPSSHGEHPEPGDATSNTEH